jgi:hypothetical protein
MKAFIVLIGLVVLSVPLSASLVTVDPDGFTAGTDISNAWAGVTLSSGGGASGLDGKVYAATSSNVAAGNLVFAHNSISSSTSSRLWLNTDTSGYYLRADFAIPTNHVMIDVIRDTGTDCPYLWIYTIGGALEKKNIINLPSTTQVYTFDIPHDTADIASIRVGGYGSTSSYAVLLDNLRFDIPEPATCLILLSGALFLKRRRK